MWQLYSFWHYDCFQSNMSQSPVENVLLRLWDDSNILCTKTSVCWKQMNRDSQSLCTWGLICQEWSHHCHSASSQLSLKPLFIWLSFLWKNLSDNSVCLWQSISFIILYYDLTFSYPCSLLSLSYGEAGVMTLSAVTVSLAPNSVPGTWQGLKLAPQMSKQYFCCSQIWVKSRLLFVYIIEKEKLLQKYINGVSHSYPP